MSKQVTKKSVAFDMCVPLNPEAEVITHYVCNVNECNSTLSALKGSNITAHMEAKHAEIFKKRWAKAKLSNVNDEEMEIRRMELIQNLTETVTRNGRPLAYLYDSGLRNLIRKEVEELKKSGYGAGLYDDQKCPPVILERISYLSSEIINAIKVEIKDSLLSLMVDIGSRNGRDILGISAQYMRDGRIIIRSLGMILLNVSRTALNVKNEILACLKLFDIKTSQVVSITSDNASNMLAMIKSFNRELDDNSDESSSGASTEQGASDLQENDFLLNESSEVFLYGVSEDEVEKVVDNYNA